jgi:hypothetical protein
MSPSGRPPRNVHMSDKLTPLIAFNDEHEELIPSGADPAPAEDD